MSLRNRRKFTPNFLPMLDVIFILLFFFMFTLIFADEHSSLGINVPKINTPSQPMKKGEKVIVSIDKEGIIIFDSKKYKDRDEFAQNISDLRVDEIFLAADGALSYEYVISLISTIKNTGISKVSLVYQDK